MMEALSSLHLLRPWWLLAAVPPLLLALVSLLGPQESAQWRGVVAPHLLRHLVSERAGRRWLSPAVVLAPLAMLLALAMAGPAYRLSDSPEGPDDTTLIVVVDLSSSMAGRDIGPSRVGRLRLKLRDLLELRRGGRVGLVAVAGGAHVVMPPTDDVDALVPYVDVLAPDLMPEDGERFAAAASLVETLARGEDGPTVALVAADSIPPDGAEALSELLGKGTALIGWAVGTAKGRPGEGVPGVDRAGFDRMQRAGAHIVDLGLGGADLRRIDGLLDAARTRIDNNEIADAGIGAIEIGGASGVTIDGNFLSTVEGNDFLTPLFVYGQNTGVVVTSNTMEGGNAAAILFGDATDFVVTGNCIRDGGTQGLETFRYGGVLVGEFDYASGFEIMDNSYEDNFANAVPVPSDVFMGWGSSNNSVLERAGTVVFDQGASNDVAFFDDDGVDHCND